MQPLTGPRAYAPLEAAVDAGEAREKACRRWCVGCAGIAGCLLLLLGPLLSGFLYPSDAPVTLEPCRDFLQLNACAWGKGLLCRSDRGQAWCPRTCGTCFPYSAGSFSLKSIANDRVEEELAFARAGGPLPEGLQGIWWMDQYGANLPIPSDPGYPYHFSACNELLVTWGEVTWDPGSRCTSPNWQNGGPIGHWTFNDVGGGTSGVWLGTIPGFLKFCFTSAALDEIEIWMGIRFPSITAPILDHLGFQRVGGGYDGFYWFPPAISRFSMVRKPWGWDRVTDNFFSDLSPENQEKLISILPTELASIAKDNAKVFHYPVFQIVDGNGQRTQNYEAYLKFANADSGECQCTGCGCPCMTNRGGNTSLVSLWTPPSPGSSVTR